MRCARDECDNTELTTKTATLRARSRVHVVLRVHSLDLGFHVVIGVGRLNVQQDDFIRQLHFTTQTQHQVQSSFLLDVLVRLCPVIVHSICIPNSCIFLIAKTSLLRCCLCMLSNCATSFPVLIKLQSTRHCCWHRNVQLSTSIFSFFA